MWVVFITSLIACFLSYSQRNTNNRIFIAFLLLAFVSSIRCDYGSDYPSYYRIFQDTINQPFSFKLLLEEGEPGWAILCYLFKPVGFFGFVAFLSFFQAIIYYKVIKKYVPLKSQWLAVVLYLFNPTIWLLQLSMMSQGLVITILLTSFYYIEQKKWKNALLLLLLASTFHQTAIILLPLAFIGFVGVKRQQIVAILLVSLALSMFFSSSVLQSVFGTAIQMAQLQYYEEYYGAHAEGEVSFGLGFLLQMVPFIVSIVLMYKKKYNQTYFLAAIIYCMTIVVLPLSKIIPLAIRVSYYFEVFSIIVIPFVISKVDNKLIKYFVFFVIFLVLLVNYKDFFAVGSVFRNSYIDYKTIFDSSVISKYK